MKHLKLHEEINLIDWITGKYTGSYTYECSGLSQGEFCLLNPV